MITSPLQSDSVPACSRKPDSSQGSEFESISQLPFSDFVRALECPEILKREAQERTLQLIDECKAALSLWRQSGYPDLGEWPDKRMGLLEYSCQQINSAIIRKYLINRPLSTENLSVQPLEPASSHAPNARGKS